MTVTDIPYNTPLYYKDICEIFSLERKQSLASKQIKDLMNYYEITKQNDKIGVKYTILKKYTEEEKEANKSPYRIPNFQVKAEDENKSGVYIIQLNDIVYIGQTINFYQRYAQHRGGKNKRIKDALQNGAIFRILEVMDKNIEQFNRKLNRLEDSYIYKYSITQNYNLINESTPIFKNMIYNRYVSNDEFYINKKYMEDTYVGIFFSDTRTFGGGTGIYSIGKINFHILFEKFKNDYPYFMHILKDETIFENIERSKKEMESKENFALLIAGSRTYNNYDEFCKVTDLMLSKIKKSYNIEIIQGGANGADKFAEIYANNHGYTCTLFKADWDNYGKSAGYRRNSEMHNYIKQFEHRGCLCFWDGFSKGTQHNFKLANDNNTTLRIYNYTNKEYIKETN